MRIGGDILVIREVSKKQSFTDKAKMTCKTMSRGFILALIAFCLIVFTYLVIYFGDQYFGSKSGESRLPIYSAYVIVSPSMVPTINVNDGVVVQRVDKQGNLNIGDIITFSSRDIRYSGLTITHRIVGKQTIQNGNLVYRTKGDNNKSEDSSLVSFGDIYGKVLFKVPSVGVLYKFITNPFGFIISIIIPIIVILVINIVKVKQLVDEERKGYV